MGKILLPESGLTALLKLTDLMLSGAFVGLLGSRGNSFAKTRLKKSGMFDAVFIVMLLSAQV